MASKRKDGHQAILAKLLADDCNRMCADCRARGPRWASWNLGVFICIRCAGIHRNLGVHISRVKSVNLDSWTPEQITSIQSWGNARANAVYECDLPTDYRRPKDDISVEAFIRNKYEKKVWKGTAAEAAQKLHSEKAKRENREHTAESGSRSHSDTSITVAEPVNLPLSLANQPVPIAHPVSTNQAAQGFIPRLAPPSGSATKLPTFVPDNTPAPSQPVAAAPVVESQQLPVAQPAPSLLDLDTPVAPAQDVSSPFGARPAQQSSEVETNFFDNVGMQQPQQQQQQPQQPAAQFAAAPPTAGKDSILSLYGASQQPTGMMGGGQMQPGMMGGGQMQPGMMGGAQPMMGGFGMTGSMGTPNGMPMSNGMGMSQNGMATGMMGGMSTMAPHMGAGGMAQNMAVGGMSQGFMTGMSAQPQMAGGAGRMMGSMGGMGGGMMQYPGGFQQPQQQQQQQQMRMMMQGQQGTMGQAVGTQNQAFAQQQWGGFQNFK